MYWFEAPAQGLRNLLSLLVSDKELTISPVGGMICSGSSKGSCGPSQNVGEITSWGESLINMEQNQQINCCISSPIPSNELFSNTVLPIRPSKRLPTRPDQVISPVCWPHSYSLSSSASSPPSFLPASLGLH
ncbi:hypothetical protein HJG60_007877 [Phyllostomus discolor]|uniref:Uncharacterized protein n=1 Tax=Phyllostomus discolor TaxID=89673 RepID=A0A834BDZ6_9CHIR|nr:hypothetical protein HJG60_007877 [Phyllostomus discolor]